MLSAFLALGNAFGTHKTGHFLKKIVILRPQRPHLRLVWSAAENQSDNMRLLHFGISKLQIAQEHFLSKAASLP